MIKKKKATRKIPLPKTPLPTPDSVHLRELLTGLLSKPNPGATATVQLFTYDQIRNMCEAFIDSLRFAVANEDTHMTQQMRSVAVSEFMGLLREKYTSIHPFEAAVMLLSMGIEMLKEWDKHADRCPGHEI